MKLLESLCRYIYYKQGVPNKNLEWGYLVLRQQFWLNVHNHGNIRNLDISVISRHSFYITITSLIIEHEPKNWFPRFFKFWFFTYIHLFINNQKFTNFRTFYVSYLLQSVLWDNIYIIFKFRNMDVCVICFDKKRHIFFLFILNPSRGGYFKGILWTYTKSTLHYYELNSIFGLH